MSPKNPDGSTRFYVDSEGKSTDAGAESGTSAESEKDERAAALDRDVNEMIIEPARAAGIELTRMKEAWPIPSKPMMYKFGGERWLHSQPSKDLERLEGGGGTLIVPGQVIERMQRLFEAGVDCDVFMVAHQLPPDWKPGQPIVPPDSKTRRQQEKVEALADGVAAAAKGVLGQRHSPRKRPVRPAPRQNAIYGGVERDGDVRWVELAQWSW